MSARHVTLDVIIEAVCATAGLTRWDIVSDRRSGELNRARFTVYWLATKLTELSSGAVGRLLGGRDHTTVLHGLQRAQELRASDPMFRHALDALLVTLTAMQRAGLLRLAASADPVATARRVLASPDREAVRVPIAEIIALCRFVADAAEAARSISPDTENSDAA